MKIFSAIQTQWNDFSNAVRSYLSKYLGDAGSNYGPSQIYGQILTVLNGMMQNLMLYIEDAFTEQNVYTAERKKSIYSLARISGYNPSLGSAAKCNIKFIFKPETDINLSSIIIPNKSILLSNQNGLQYNIILPQESIVLDVKKDNNIKHMSVVEGLFETQTFTSTGGQLYTVNVPFTGDVDIDFFTVMINGDIYEMVSSLYDMSPNEKQYFIQTSLSKGIDLVFGNGQYGRILEDGDSIVVNYLAHSGELGNITPDENTLFLLNSPLKDITGNDVDGNNIFLIQLENRDGITSGSYSEDARQVQKMIGYNSRSLVLADPKNYKLLLSRFSFVGYNRCWSAPGTLLVNALVMKNFKQLMSDGNDYFTLSSSDYFLSQSQQSSIINSINNSGQQYSGTVLNFLNPILKKYAMFIYLKMKDGVVYDKNIIENQIKNILGLFFADLYSDIYIPKSDIIQKIKNEITQIDGINIYIISEENETAKINGYYDDIIFKYNPATMNYTSSSKRIYINSKIDPMLGLDVHGNILLENDMYFPVLMGDWDYSSGTDRIHIQSNNPIKIIFQ